MTFRIGQACRSADGKVLVLVLPYLSEERDSHVKGGVTEKVGEEEFLNGEGVVRLRLDGTQKVLEHVELGLYVHPVQSEEAVGVFRDGCVGEH